MLAVVLLVRTGVGPCIIKPIKKNSFLCITVVLFASLTALLQILTQLLIAKYIPLTQQYTPCSRNCSEAVYNICNPM